MHRCIDASDASDASICVDMRRYASIGGFDDNDSVLSHNVFLFLYDKFGNYMYLSKYFGSFTWWSSSCMTRPFLKAQESSERIKLGYTARHWMSIGYTNRFTCTSFVLSWMTDIRITFNEVHANSMLAQLFFHKQTIPVEFFFGNQIYFPC